MLRKKSGFGALVQVEAPHVVVIRCFLHRHALASKTLSPRLKSAMDTAVQSVNFIRFRALNHRLFKIFCQEVGATHELMLYHTEVRWLSHGQSSLVLWNLELRFAMFLREKEKKLREELETLGFIVSLAYLAGIFSHLNELNISLQGSEVTVLDVNEKNAAFQQKLAPWKRHVAEDNYADFPTLENVVLSGQGVLETVPGQYFESSGKSHALF
jgi:hypothetical protein